MNMKRGPWTIKKRTQKYKDKYLELNVDEVIRPDGKPGIFSSVTIRSGAAILPIDDKGYVYLLKEFHYSINKYNVEVVSGGIEDGNTPLQTAKIELLEEAGIKAKKWIKLGVLHPLTSQLYCQIHLFLARDLLFGKQNLEGTENIKVKKVKFEKAVNMVMNNKIFDACSSVLILKAQNYLKYKK